MATNDLEILESTDGAALAEDVEAAEEASFTAPRAALAPAPCQQRFEARRLVAHRLRSSAFVLSRTRRRALTRESFAEGDGGECGSRLVKLPRIVFQILDNDSRELPSG